ncbi:MAG TPA: PepSY-associated TM helix domain-containing protein [Pusillimonas sp.]|uniref:PepSY-associated TM helix domain-containing protein n=1 Tax=unclassified Pusillimonas TaxID=2640016 RepID=UPI00262BB469|nr:MULTISPECIES: PepSY-associated TM helix domain-containing protein [unclassified Pusillimonas]HLU19568.1 PepSY-associated TM helix domain-containing protein [Pusillimonas sp.]
MTAAASLKTWYWWHKWTSLICTVFLLVICITGLPLVFHEEIEHWLEEGKPYAVVEEGTPRVPVDQLMALARGQYPNEVLEYVYFDEDHPTVYIGMSPSHTGDPKQQHYMRFDAHTAELLHDAPTLHEEQFSFMGLMLALHVDLFTGLPGQLFLGFMGLLFVIALVSGVVLYGPFMKKLNFGTVRKDRSRRLKWLDLHNLLGIVLLGWMMVVGITGVINELSRPLFAIWQGTDLVELTAAYRDAEPPAQLASADAALRATAEAVPGHRIISFSHPGNMFATPHHYMVWTHGDTPFTSHLIIPVLVDAATAEVTAVARPPWYLTMLALSQPLHFGDYGGMPLKILWALLDLLTIVVLVSGLYLWLARRKATDARVARLMQAHQHADLALAKSAHARSSDPLGSGASGGRS